MQRISLIIPAYNRQSTIAAAVSTALLQTWPELEVIVVDDGSTDRTASVVEAFDDPRLILLRQQNQGAAAARNTGIAAATGELLSFLDSDDLIFDTHLEALHQAWERGGRGLATANAHYLTAAGLVGTRHPNRRPSGIPGPEQQRLAILQANFCSPMSLFSAALALEAGPMDTSLPRCEDWQFWLRMVFAGAPVAHQPVPLAVMRRTHESMTSDRELVWRCEEEIMRRMAARDDLRPDEQQYLAHRLATGAPSQWYEAADQAVRERRWRQAAREYRTAASLAPSEKPLRRKAQLMRLAPAVVGPLLRRRDRGRVH